MTDGSMNMDTNPAANRMLYINSIWKMVTNWSFNLQCFSTFSTVTIDKILSLINSTKHNKRAFQACRQLLNICFLYFTFKSIFLVTSTVSCIIKTYKWWTYKYRKQTDNRKYTNFNRPTFPDHWLVASLHTLRLDWDLHRGHITTKINLIWTPWTKKNPRSLNYQWSTPIQEHNINNNTENHTPIAILHTSVKWT